MRLAERLVRTLKLERFLVGEGPQPGPVELHRRRVYILPSRIGLGFALLLALLLLGSTNYGNSLGFMLTFLLFGMAWAAMHHTYRNLVRLRVQAGPAAPVFAGTPEKGIGLAYMMGPTGGYLLGFIMAATLCGWLAERGWDRRVSSTIAALLLGNAVIYLPGLLWLGTLLGWDKPVLEWGLYPFILGDLLKLGLAAAALPFAWKLLRRV